jgi:flagellar hook-length control protein FliK
VQRVAKAFHTLGNNEGEMKLRLSPPELGAVKLEVSYREGVLHARLETESTSTRNVIMENLPQLKERLAEQNVRIETFDVNVRDQNSGNNSQQQYDFAREQMERARTRAQNLPNQSAQIARAATNTVTRNISLNQNSTQLNVII